MADLFVLKELFVHETYKNILRNLPKEGVRFIDVGGNIGAFTVWLASKTKTSEGFIFEPLESNRKLLTFNLSINKIKNVEVIPAALGGADRQIAMFLNLNSPGGSSLYTKQNNGKRGTEKIQVKAFRRWLDETRGKFHLLKIDCEGAEWEILKATPPEYFRRFQLVVAEVHATKENSDVTVFKKYFEEAGFETKQWDNCSHGLYIGVRKK
jgi:FkbM family methyltransferase